MKITKSNKNAFIASVGITLILAVLVIYKFFPFQNKSSLYTSPKTDGFAQFSVTLPSGWQTKNIDNKDPFSVEFVRDDYAIRILKPISGSVCVFPTDKAYDGPTERFEDSINLQTNFGEIKLGKVKSSVQILNKTKYIACSIKYGLRENNQIYLGTGTEIGHIEYLMPPTFDQNILLEMNNIIKTIKLVNF